MANVNIALVTLANTFNDWRIGTNNLANSVNNLRNSDYVKDAGSFIVAAGSLQVTSTSGTGLAVTNNVLFSQLTQMNTFITTGDASLGHNVSMTNANSTLNVSGNLYVGTNSFLNGPLTVSTNGSATINSNMFLTDNATVANTGTWSVRVGNTGSFRVESVNDNLSNVNSFLIARRVSGTSNVANVDYGNSNDNPQHNFFGIMNVASINVATINISATSNNTGNAIISGNLTVGGNTVVGNLTVNGTTTTLGNSVSTSDTIILRNTLGTSGNGHFIIEQGGTNGNADFRFLQASNVWQLTANTQNGYSTIIVAANIADSVSNSSITSVASANAVEWAYNTALNAYAVANTGGGGTAIAMNAYGQANSAYAAANGAYAQANGAYAQANLVYAAANAAVLQSYANGTLVLGASNTNYNNTATVNVGITANGTGQTNVAFTANITNITSAVTTIAENAYGQANTGVTNAATAETNALNAYAAANSGITIAENAYAKANAGATVTSVQATGSTSNYDLIGVNSLGTSLTIQGNSSVFVVSANSQVVAVDFAATSDGTLKDITGIIDNALEKVNKIDGVEFTWNKIAHRLGIGNEGPQVGVIAQDVQAVLPEAVSVNDKTGKLLVSYDKLVPLLIEAIKELSAKVDALENR
jgi:trimeric autotransporter adhesin